MIEICATEASNVINRAFHIATGEHLSALVGQQRVLEANEAALICSKADSIEVSSECSSVSGLRVGVVEVDIVDGEVWTCACLVDAKHRSALVLVSAGQLSTRTPDRDLVAAVVAGIV